ncbi:MAG: nickel pincer cofactor biosynthesis protein LarC [Lachnospiraceae bacterium]|nr:nickel pincer cofactor biosynthesis protein LarC [Lachnospiraceae bacterium]
MRTLFIECNMGASGDMLMGALYELLSDSQKESFLKTMNNLFPNQILLQAVPAEKCGVWGTKINVVILGQEETPSGYTASSAHDPEHTHHDTHTDLGHLHTSYPEMQSKIDNLLISDNVKEHAKAVYTLIGNAESLAHNTDLSQIHFHEVGTLDALMDVVGCCLLTELLNPEQILASPVHVGTGSVRCAHGILPVPTPATAEILKDVPIYAGSIEGELCTPTGAALLKHFVSQFTPMPPISVEQTGYGMGTKDFPSANCVRAFLGFLSALPVPAPRQLPGAFSPGALKLPREEETHPDYYTEQFHSLDQILELSCNLDDMTPEAVSYAVTLLREAGALDVYTTPIYMKKSRPGTLLTVLCNLPEESRFSRLILTHTATRGIRIQPCYRRTLDAQFRKISTVYGEITIKINTGYGISKYKPEYEDVAAAARQCKVPFQTVYETALEVCRKML